MRAYENAGKKNVMLVQISKLNDTLIVDDTPYEFISQTSERPLFGNIIKRIETKIDNTLAKRAESNIQALQTRIQHIKDSDNLFLSNDDYQLIQRYADKLDKQLNVLLANIKTL
jgi:RNase adaptor protein for sRNA GlmZ degradation